MKVESKEENYCKGYEGELLSPGQGSVSALSNDFKSLIYKQQDGAGHRWMGASSTMME